jgi:Tfp pilus assembly protein PilX
MTSLYTHTQQQKHSQNGAVLVMALVLLTVMTLIGVASMTGSSMQMRVASNMQQHNIAFQAAQSRVQYILNQPPGTPTSPSPNAIDVKVNIPTDSSGNVVPPVQTQTCNLSDGCPDDTGGTWTADAKIFYEGCTTGFGNSKQSGKSVGIRTFEIQVTATAAGGIARSIQGQGVHGTVKECP